MAVLFVGGNDVIESFLLTHTDGSIVDLTTMQPLSGGVWWRGRKRIDLAIGSGIRVDNAAPALAGSGEEQDHHGFVFLIPAQTALIPFGQIASIRLDAVSLVEGYVMSSYLETLERIT